MRLPLSSWGNGSWNPMIYQGFCTSKRWLGMEFLLSTAQPLLRKPTYPWDSKHCPKDLLHKALQHPSSKIWRESFFVKTSGGFLPCKTMVWKTNKTYLRPNLKGSLERWCFFFHLVFSFHDNFCFPNLSIYMRNTWRKKHRSNASQSDTMDFLYIMDPSSITKLLIEVHLSMVGYFSFSSSRWLGSQKELLIHTPPKKKTCVS